MRSRLRIPGSLVGTLVGDPCCRSRSEAYTLGPSDLKSRALPCQTISGCHIRRPWAASTIGVSAAGVLLVSSQASAFTWLLAATVVLLVVSLRNTWDLLVTVGDVTLGGEANKD